MVRNYQIIEFNSEPKPFSSERLGDTDDISLRLNIWLSTSAVANTYW